MDVFGNVGGTDVMFNSGPSFFNLISTLVIVIVVGGMLFVVVKGLSQWTANNDAQLLTRKCLVVDKRKRVWADQASLARVRTTISRLNLSMPLVWSCK